MKSNERPHKNLERKRGLFLRIGLMISLLITFLAFEWKTTIPRTDITDIRANWDPIEEVMVPVTWQKEEVMLPKPKALNHALAPVESNPEIIIIPDDGNPTLLPSDSIRISEIIPIDIMPESDTLPDDFVYAAEINPVFPGKEKAMMKFLENNLRYPEEARKEGVNGTVYVNFIVDEKGLVTNVECKHSPSPYFTAEAIRVMQKMPRWKPGIQGGKPVRVKMAMPVTFKLL